jgi:acetyl-CoA C-acetyltransferase
MKEVFVVDALRTPFGSFGGQLADVPAPRLAATVLARLLEKHRLPAAAVNEVILGQVIQGGCGQAPARQAMRAAGIPDSAGAMTINKVCGSGLKTMMLAAQAIQCGDAQIVLAGGMENMSMAPYAVPSARYGQRMGNTEMLDLMIYDALKDPYTGRHMGEITEAWIEANGVSRAEQDDFAERSYRRAQAALKNGTFAEELVAVVKSGRKGEICISEDEEPLKVDFERLRSLKTVFKKDGSITAANASTINDGAGAALLVSAEAAKAHNLKPVARIVTSVTNSLAPELFPEAPVGAIRKAVERSGLRLSDIGLFEINEAFAAVTFVAIRDLGLDPERVNVNGGAVAIGHPVGASGARLAATLLREMRARKERYGLATLCIGGGEAVAVIFELV